MHRPVNAIDRYDLSRGRAFSSFAVPTIAGEIKRYYRDKTWAVNVPRDLQDRTLAVDRAARELESTLGHHPTISELADHLGVEDEDILETLHAKARAAGRSLDAPTPTTSPRPRATPSRAAMMAFTAPSSAPTWPG